MPPWFGSRKPALPECVGLSFYAGGIACVITEPANKKLVSAHFLPIADESGLADALQQWVRETGRKGNDCYVSLGTDDYKLISAEAPAVPDDEMNQALLWGLREVIDSKPDETAIDNFPSASGINRPGKPTRYVVTARKARIRTIVDAVRGAGLELKAIEISELSQRNVMATLGENTIGAGLVSQNARGVSVAIYRGGELYVTRQLAGIANLNEAGHPLTAPRLVEQLGLELLRTLDYYDSQLRQRPPAAIFLQPLAVETRPLLDGLSATINLPARQLTVADIVAGAENLSAEMAERCIIALGATLRAPEAPQQINFYTAEFQPRREWLTAQRCAQLWGAVAAAGVLIAVGLGWHNHALRSDAAQLQAELQGEQTALTNAQTQLAARAPSPALTAELQRRHAEEAAKTELLAVLESGVLRGRDGYTPILTSLARNTVEGLWLTQIDIAGGDVNLAGAARKAELIPIYIDKIVGASGFGARDYESLDVKAAENGLLTFALRGRRDSHDTNDITDTTASRR